MKKVTFDYWVNQKEYIVIHAWGQKNQLGRMRIIKLSWDDNSRYKIPVEIAEDIERSALTELNR